jgi:diguanylate cyclase (GGDEF)-like protein
MKRLVAAFAIALASASAGWAAAPVTITSLREIHLLTNEQASHALPVAFEATVNYSRAYEKTTFVQDGDVAIYVQTPTTLKLVPGDRIFIKGTTQPSFKPFILSNDITLLHHGPVPMAIPATYDELIRAEHDCMLVSVFATVRAADLVRSSDVRSSYLQMLTDGGAIDAVVDSDDESQLHDLLDAQVEITGAVSGNFDGKMQQTGILIHASSFANIKVLKRADAGPSSLPITPMDQVLTSYHVQVRSQRVRVHGTITYFQPGALIVLQSGTRSLRIQTRSLDPVRIGDLADVTGFPGLHDGFLTLTNGEIEDSHIQAPIIPLPSNWAELALSHHGFDLVSIEGQVITEVRESDQDEYVLIADGQVFSAVVRHPPPSTATQVALLPMRQVPIGSKVRLTGICLLEDSNPFNAQVPFTILMRSGEDISILSDPSLLTVRNLILIVGLLVIVLISVGARGWIIEHRVRRQTAALAYVEQRRSHILEDINGSRPLTEILEEITELVSFRLKGAPCWCQIADGAKLGNCPPKLASLRIIQNEVPSHSGSALGTIYAAFDPLTKRSPNELEALSMAVALAALAIETRRLYSDLLHRSEFDLLTDTQNRFSLERDVERQIHLARENATIFGLVYIDLDNFKQVNDLYGHNVGDLFLQESVTRMKRQLRPHDKLARIGGDEFAALFPLVRNRADVEDIAHRLERSFDEPFVFQGYTLHGSASVGIALFPEDATSLDTLLSVADAAMYVAKNIKRPMEEGSSSRHSSELAPRETK